MIAKLLIFVLKSSLFLLNLSMFTAIFGCAKAEKSTPSNPSNPSNLESKTDKKSVSTISTEKEPSKTPTPMKTPSKKATPVRKPSKPELELQKTQYASKESVKLKPPPRSREVVKQQKTMKDVQEVDAKGVVVLGEKSADQDEFDDYLNKLGESQQTPS